MMRDSIRSFEGDAPSVLTDAVGSGTLDGVVLVEAREAPHELAVVRPLVGDDDSRWTELLVTLIARTEAVIVGLVSSEPRLAATVACAYASWSGDRGTDSLLVDGSLETPTIDKPLREDGDEGLVDAVSFGVSPTSVARRTLAHGVRVVTAGSHPLSVTSALEPDKLRELVSALGPDLALVVLPSAYLEAAAPGLDAALLIERDAGRLVESAGRARAAGIVSVVGMYACRPHDEASEEEREAGAEVARNMPVRPPEESVTVEARQSTEEPSPFVEERSPSATEEPSPFVEERPGAAGEGASQFVEDEPRSVEQETSPFVDEETGEAGSERSSYVENGPVVTAARSQERRRNSRARWVVLPIVVIAVVAVWFSLRPGMSPRIPGLHEGNGQEVNAPQGDDGVGRSTPGELRERSDDDVIAPPGGDGATRPAPGEPQAGEAPERGGGEETPAEVVESERATAPARTADTGTSPLEAPLAGHGGTYTVYLSSHRILTAAEFERDQASERGISAVIVDTDLPESGLWHRVSVEGGFSTLAEARNALDIVKELGYEGAWIGRIGRED